MKPSEVTQIRDESFSAQLRRGALWTLLLGSLWLIPMLAVMIATLAERKLPVPFGPGPLVHSVIDLVRNGTSAHPQPWWTQLPDPKHSPTSPISMFIGFCAATVLYTGLGTWAWQSAMTRTGARERDTQRRRQLDGAQWATPHDIQPFVVSDQDLGTRVVLGTSRLPRVKGGLIAVQAGHSVLVVAPTGQGKTESLIAPAILEWDGPVLCGSIKNDVYDLTAGHRATLGETRVLDPAGLTDPTQVRNAYWTPIPEASTWRGARTLADQMCGVGMKGAQAAGNEKYFADASGELLAGLLFAAAHSPVPTMNTVQTWLTNPAPAMAALEVQLNSMVGDDRLDDEVRYNAPHALSSIKLRMVGEDPKQVEAIRSTVGNAIRAWNDYRLAHVGPDDPGMLSPNWLWDEPSKWEQKGQDRTLYLIGPQSDQASFRGMFVGAVTQIYNAYARAQQGENRPKKRLLVVLDEVANMTPIPTLDTWVTAARGLGINLVLATQNLAQLDTVWGREKAETIASGPRVRMFGPGIADKQTLEYVEKIGGQTAVLSDTVSKTPYFFQMQTSRATHTQWRPLVQQQELRELPDFTGLVFSGTAPPFKVNWRSGQNDPGLAEMERLKPIPPSDAEVEHLCTPRGERPLLLPVDLTATPARPAGGRPMPENWEPGQPFADDGRHDHDDHDDESEAA